MTKVRFHKYQSRGLLLKTACWFLWFQLFILFRTIKCVSGFPGNFSKNSNLDDSGIPFPIFPSRTNLKLRNITVTPKIVKKLLTNLVSSKASDPDCIPVVVLKYCDPELSYILAGFFIMCLKDSFFQIVGRSHHWSLFLRMLGSSLQLKTAALLVFFLLSVKSSKNL